MTDLEHESLLVGVPVLAGAEDLHEMPVEVGGAPLPLSPRGQRSCQGNQVVVRTNNDNQNYSHVPAMYAHYKP